MEFWKRVSALFGLNDRGWMRHANPWSVYTRYLALPMLVLAIWSRSWVGGWYLAGVAAAIGWIFLNPILFSPPVSTRNWASRAVLGERVWLDRKNRPLPAQHANAVIPVSNLFSAIGFAAALFGAWKFDATLAIGGTLVTILAKSWFLDRMVWIWLDVKDTAEEYRERDF